MRRHLLVFMLLWGQVWPAVAQNLVFKKGDRVCFVGNSITNNGEFHHNVLLYYLTRFPDQPVHFFNCGISGDVIGGIFNRLTDDILVHQPTHAVIMIGMNDVNRGLYAAKPTANADTLQRRAAALSKYRLQLDSLVRVFLAKNIQVILQKPSIYDQTAVLKTPNNWGVNDALKQCADYAQVIADKYQLKTVDYWTILTQINASLQAKDSSASIIGTDRVHPAAAGHLVMAYQFLKTFQQPRYVSQIVLAKSKTAPSCHNCEIAFLSRQKGEVVFRVKEFALPFPTNAAQQKALSLVPFVHDFNQEILAVKSLSKGSYQLSIDDVVIDTFRHEQLHDGINLAEFPHSPQLQQAQQVRSILAMLWSAEADLRTLKFVEYGFLKDYPAPNDLEAVKRYLEELFTTKLSHNPYFKNQFDRYVLVKPKEKSLRQESDELRQKAYETAIPKPHTFKLSSVK